MRFDRLQYVMIEASLSRSLQIILVTPSRQCDQDRLPSIWQGPQALCSLNPVHPWHSEIEEDNVRTECGCLVRPSCPSDAVTTSCPNCSSNIAKEVAASSLSSTTRIRRRGAAGVSVATAARLGAAAGPVNGSRTENMLPRPSPGLATCTEPPCISTSCPLALPFETRIPLHAAHQWVPACRKTE